MVGDTDERQSVLGNFLRLGDYLKKVQWSSFLIIKHSFFGRNDAKAETPVLWPPHAKS